MIKTLFQSNRTTWTCVILLAILNVWMSFSASFRFGSTGDEIAHMTGGYSYWKLDDYRMHPENGILAQRWLALPLLALNPILPPAEDISWIEGSYRYYSESFFYEQGNDLPRMLAVSRFMNSLLGGVLVIACFGWARSLFGTRGGWVSALLAAFAPELLAHAGLANSDITSATAFCLALLAWWRLLHTVTPARIIAAGLATGILATSKFSAILLGPVVIGMLVLRLARKTPLPAGWSAAHTRWTRRGTKFFSCATATVGALVVCIGVIWAAYGFRYQAAPNTPELGAWGWDKLLAKSGHGHDVIGRFVVIARDHQLLPEAWLYGLAYVDRNARARPAFLAGEYSPTGWRTFFPVAFMVKSTVGALLLITLAGILPWFGQKRRTRRWLYRLSPLLLFTVVYGAAAVTSNINIGHRHILPLYPALYILAGGAMAGITGRRSRATQAIVWLCVLMHIGASLGARPYYLAYFNELAGGSSKGYRLLVDSSLDWGQGIPELVEWLERNAGDSPLYLTYFGNDRPARLGLRINHTGDNFISSVPSPPPRVLGPGIYCISATLLNQVYAPFHLRWTDAKEKHYWEFRKEIASQSPSAPSATTSQTDPGEASIVPAQYDYLRFNRLCVFLRRREPDATIGHSILIYRLSADDITNYLDTPAPPE